MFLITCPVTRTDELVADRRIRSLSNHPTHIAMAVECPACGGVHVYRTGRRWQATGASATDVTATGVTATGVTAAAEVTAAVAVTAPAGPTTAPVRDAAASAAA
jgi:hypothetical protein